VVHYAGDAVLADFGTVIDALTCASRIQNKLQTKNTALPPDRRVEFRIGVNLGDVIVDQEEIYGDGVNIAARLQGLAEPGGICISESVRTAVGNKVLLDYEFMGEQEVKNISGPVRAYRVNFGTLGSKTPNSAEPRSLELPKKPSIAVLPFTNMSTESEQEYFSDGITEEIITALSKIEDMFVIALNSVFSFKGQTASVQEVAGELGVRYVVEGSVRKAGDRIRVTAQLVDAQTGQHLWADRYDRTLADILDVQDEITQEIVTALQVRLTEGEQARLRRRQTKVLRAWEYFVRGQTVLRRFNKPDNLESRALLEQAVDLDSNFAAPWVMLAWTHLVEARLGWSTAAEVSLEQGAALCQKSISLDDSQPDAYALMGAIRLHQRRYEEAEAEGRRAVELGPNVADAYILLAQTLNYMGQPKEALGLIQKSMRFSPFYPAWYLSVLGVNCRMLGRYEEAIKADLEQLQRNPENTFSNYRLAAVYAELDRFEEAQTQIGEVLQKNPQASIRQARICEPYRDAEKLERHIESLRKAGLPE
jgi:adenylate cyclase